MIYKADSAPLSWLYIDPAFQVKNGKVLNIASSTEACISHPIMSYRENKDD